MEENQKTSSKSNKRKKKKNSGSGEKPEERHHLESLSEKQLSSQPQQSKPQKQTVAEKQPNPQQEQCKPEKQPKSPKLSQLENEPSSKKKLPQEDKSQPKPKKQHKSPKESLSEPVTQPQPVTRPALAKESQKKKGQPVTQPALAKESQKKKGQPGTQLKTTTQPAPVIESLKKEDQLGTQLQGSAQSQAVTQSEPAKKSHKKKSQPDTQPKSITHPQTVTQPAPSKQTPKQQSGVEKRTSPAKQLSEPSAPESKPETSDPCPIQPSLKLGLKSNNSAAGAETTRIQGPGFVKETKCVPSGDSPACEVTTGAPRAKESDVVDATCARNASASIASAAPITQISKMTGATDGKAEGRPAINKSREEIEAERKLRKAAKLAKKGKKTEEEAKNVQQVEEGVKQLKVDEKVEAPKENVEKSSVPKVEVKKASEGETTAKQPAEGGKSKAELRAERRAIQEAQRAAKAASKDTKIQQEKQQQQPSKPAADKPPAAASDRIASKPKLSSLPKTTERSVKLFSHLYQCSFKTISQSLKVNHPQYHPAIVRLGVQYSERVVLGSNARCVALLHALKKVIADYETPPQKEFARGLEAYLQPNVEFLQRCRPLAVSMTNALRHVKRQLTALPNNIKDSQARQKLLDSVDTYIKDQIETAAEAIGITAEEKIADGDVILVYACSSLVLHALKMTHSKGKKFSVVVVDSLPWLEGREMLRRLVSVGIKCTYVHISAASFIMREVTKVLLGAHALLTNGYVMSRAGSSQIALLAHSYNVPVLVCCETHKFSERVQTDSFVYNELANPDELVGKRRNGEDSENKTLPLECWRDLPYLTLLNLVYDVTPPDLVTAVVTELAILPCTSVPVILRIRPTDC